MRSGARVALIDRLLDRHGTGRVLFRNSRARIRGFPKRINTTTRCRYRHSTGLPCNPPILLLQTALHRRPPTAGGKRSPGGSSIPRLEWLIQKLHQLRWRQTGCAYLRLIRKPRAISKWRCAHARSPALFMGRQASSKGDRAAAWFAGIGDDGAQLLIIYQEIGGEGRNFSLPTTWCCLTCHSIPDLLEQRIGCLDRIGQLEKIHSRLLLRTGCKP